MTNLSANTKEEVQHKLSFLYTFFCWCSGARLYILKKCPSDFNKYYGIGVIVFLTGVMASVSGGYAIYTVFKSLEVSIGFGILWGFLIFSIDWYLVSSLRKQQRFRKELGMAIPRFVLAVLIAFVISKPLEMKLFDREIEQQIVFNQQQKAIDYHNLVTSEYSDIEKLENENESLRSELSKKQAQREQLFSMIITEAEGQSPTRKVGKGPVYREKKSEYDRVVAEIEQLSAQSLKRIEQNTKLLDELRQQRNAIVSTAETSYRSADGFLSRIDAMSQLSSHSLSIRLASLFIILLFIVIESAPIIVKLLSSRGPYDDLLEAEEYLKQVEVRKVIVQAELTEDHRIDLHRLLEKERNAILYEIEKGHIQNEARVLAEINKLKILKWKEEELSKLFPEGPPSANTEAPQYEIVTPESENSKEVSNLFEPEPAPDLKSGFEPNYMEGVDSQIDANEKFTPQFSKCNGTENGTKLM